MSVELAGNYIHFTCHDDKSTTLSYDVKFSYESAKLRGNWGNSPPRIRMQAIEQWIDVEDFPAVIRLFTEVYEYAKNLEKHLVVEVPK